MSKLRDKSLQISIILFFFGGGFQMAGVVSFPLSIIFFTLGFIFALIFLWDWLEGKDLVFLKKFNVGLIAVVIILSAGVFYYIKGIYIPKLYNQIAELNDKIKNLEEKPKELSTNQLTPEQIEEKISEWLLMNNITTTKIPDDTKLFNLQFIYNDQYGHIVYYKTTPNRIQIGIGLHIRDDMRQTLDKMTAKQRDQLGRELRVEMLKSKDIFYESLGYPFTNVKIYTWLFVQDLTEPALFEKIDTVFRVARVLQQSMVDKLPEGRKTY